MNTLTQQTLNNPSEAARKIIQDHENGVVVFGSQKKQPIVTKKPPRKYNYYFLVILLFFLAYYYCFIMGKHKITGFVVSDDAQLLKNQQIAFYNTDTQHTTTCTTNSEAEFTIRLLSGNYRVYAKGSNISKIYQNPQASLINLQINDSYRYRITVRH